jgi:putative oxidoreductase
MIILSRFSAQIYALLRIVTGLMFAMHGAQKLFGWPSGPAMTGDPMMLTAALIEFVGGLMIGLGLGTRIAAFIASGEMAVAYFMVHAKTSFYPLINHGELAVVYCFLFLYFASMGSGTLSLKGMMKKKG